MKRSIQITMLTILVFLLNPINLLDQLNQLNQINGINRITNSIAWAQESKNQPSAGSAQPAPISKHPFQTLPLGVSENYIIGQGDVLEVFVWRNEQLSREVTVRPDGKISLPLIQDLQAEGFTALQLKDQITRKLKQYVQNPTVTVIVNEINSYKVSVLGKVATPGVYAITTRTTLVEAISMAGGFTEWASKKEIILLRKVNGKDKILRINYKKIVKGDDFSQNVKLKADDTIIVP